MHYLWPGSYLLRVLLDINIITSGLTVFYIILYYRVSSPLAQLYSTSTMERHHFDRAVMIINTQVRAELEYPVLCATDVFRVT